MNFSRAAARARAKVRARVRGRAGKRPEQGPDRGASGKAGAANTAAPLAAVTSPPAGAVSHAEIRTIFFGLMLAAFLAALNQTIIATALPTIGRHFADFENLSWVVTAYLLTSTAVAPLYGKLADIHGRRAILLTAVGLFIAGSILCAAAPNMMLLILGRGLQGIGGGGILPLCQTVIADVVAPRERGRYQAYMGVVWVTSGVFGPVLGGVLAEFWHWSLIFWINVPLGLAAALLIHIHLKRIPRHERRHKLDLLGAMLMMGSAIPLLLALTWGGTQYSWASPEIVVLLAASFVLSLAFGWRLTRAPEPFLPLTVLNNPVMRWGTTCGLARDGRLDRPHHLRAALFRGRAQALRDRIRHRADPARAHDARLAALRPSHALLAALQARPDHRPRLLAGRAGVPDLAARPAAHLRDRDHGGDRHRHRPGLSGDHGVDPERSAALSGRHRDGRAQLLPLARERLRGGGDGRDPVGRSRRDAAARSGRVSRDLDDERERL